jgi:predicted carbohydrate-binding protein with CBM5 and CBM33 domain
VKFLRRAAATAAAAVVAAGVIAVITPDAAEAHGAAIIPGSRTRLCWQDGLSSTGQIIPNNPACAAAVAQSGTNPLYNWFSVLRSDAAGRTTGFVPDGELCSGGNTTFSGYNLARTDWPTTHLTAGRTMEFRYSNWAHHPGTFYFYVTNNNWSPTRPLAWSDLESTPFLTVTNPPSRGAVGTNDGHYYFTGTLPSGKSGRHIIYSRWVRSDSAENFFGCSDVLFDGGNGEVTGVGPGQGTITPGPTTSGPTTGPTTGGPNPGTGSCAATYRTVSSWSGGFQGEVSVRNSGTAAIPGWSVGLTLASGQSISNLWNGTLSGTAPNHTVRNANYNGALNANAATTFGFVASGGATAPTVTCSVA